ncbi:MAG: T9SS type A sorting domain-containing protein [Psychroserpens sp.]|uniref:T9SS type A sorting domain-containing protein n=1 Tax=Psychroserpens sp. TaxID=2020870 RepID=UPI0030035211
MKQQVKQILMIATLALFTMPVFANDDCANAIPIGCDESVTGSTSGATADSAPFCDTSNTSPGVWYSYTSADAKEVTITTCDAATSYDTKLTVYAGSCAGLTCVVGNDDDSSCGTSIFQSTVTFSADAGTTYLILVHGFGTATGDFTLSTSCIEITPPTNDGPCDATALTLGVAEDYNNSFATADVGEVSPGAGTGDSSCDSQDGWCSFETAVQNSVWFSFEVPASGSVSIGAPGFDSQIAVWSAGDCSDYGSFTEVGANDDGGSGSSTLFSAYIELSCLTPGDTLLVQLDGFAGAIGSDSILVDDLGGTPLIADAGGCQTKFVGYEPAEELNHLVASVLGGTGPFIYAWSGAGIVTNPNIFSVSVDPTETTTYTVTVTDANGCTSESSVDVNVVDLACGKNGNKISVCHIPLGNPDNAHEICISEVDVAEHLAHGDHLGFCGNTCLETNPPPPVCVAISIEITTDNFGGETSWNLTDENGGLIASGDAGTLSNATTITVYDECVLPGCYSFNISDSFGDGICCGFGLGSYSITYDGVTTGSPTGGAFGSGESVPFGTCDNVRLASTQNGIQAQSTTKGLGEVTVLPNPFTTSAIIKYLPSINGNATIDIYNLNGSHITRILDTQVKRGEVINAEIRGDQLRTNGIYIYQIRIADKIFSGKLIYMK